MALLKCAASLPVLLLRPVSRDDEWSGREKLLTPAGSVRNYTLLEKLCENLAAAGCPASYLAEQHGDGRRDFYFAAEDPAGFAPIAQNTAQACGFPLTIEQHAFAGLAPLLLVTEAIGDLGLTLDAEALLQMRRFEFWGADTSLEKLRAKLEARGFGFLGLDMALRELRMAKKVAIDGPGFLAVLRDIVPLARALGCSYRGTETVDGAEQFYITRPLPARYITAPTTTGMLGRVFGRKR